MRMVLLLLVFAACDTVDLDVVNVNDGGTFEPATGPPCARVGDCVAGQLCEKDACGEALGRCVQRPAFCDGDSRPECGCDGVTYWNDCLRRKAGVESRVPGPCVNPLRCDSVTPCPQGSSCGFLVFPNECGRVAAGVCFVMPDACQGMRRDHFYACDDLGRTQCLDACQAVVSGQPAAQFPGPCQ